MKYFKTKIKVINLIYLIIVVSCTKLNTNLNGTLTTGETKQSVSSLLLQAAYNDLAQNGGVFQAQNQVFSLEENSTDESLVPTRAGDWDDGGVWREVHAHTWTADHSQVLATFNNLNTINFDATNALQFLTDNESQAEARFLRVFSLYYLMDLYGQFPLRNPGDNLLTPSKVLTGITAANYIISELNQIIPQLDTTSSSHNTTRASKNSAIDLLMHCYLQKGTWLNRMNPTFDDADMVQVITLGKQIMNSGSYSLENDYFKNFTYNNSSSREIMFAYPNFSGAAVSGGIPNSQPHSRWMMTLHYNSYGRPATATTSASSIYGNAGWNGFSTISDFYNTFNVNQTTDPFVYGPSDTAADTRLGGRYRTGLTNISGLRAGFLVGPQYYESGDSVRHDRKGNVLSFYPSINPTMKETAPDSVELAGIRVVKYVPDFFDVKGSNYASNAGNWLILMRFPDIMLMVAEAELRSTSMANPTDALNIVNSLRTARGASTFGSIMLNTSIVDDPSSPNTIIAERGREFYWESYRRTDLERFGLFLSPWLYKPSPDPSRNLLFPIPTQALSANPNYTQNTGY